MIFLKIQLSFRNDPRTHTFQPVSKIALQLWQYKPYKGSSTNINSEAKLSFAPLAIQNKKTAKSKEIREKK